jgi:hypothetical protein
MEGENASSKKFSFSTKLVALLQRCNDNGDCDHLIRQLRAVNSSGSLRLYLSLNCVENDIVLQKHHSYEIKVLNVNSDAKCLFADRLLDCSDTLLPLVKVKFIRGNDIPLSHQIISEIADKGFIFLGERFHFLAFKDLGSQFAYFFNPSRSKYLSSFDLWQSIGNFIKLPHVPVLAMRLGLLVSGACQGLTAASDIVIKVIDDVYLSPADCTEIATGSKVYLFIKSFIV